VRSLLLSLICVLAGGAQAANVEEREELGRLFEAAGTHGTIVVRDAGSNRTVVYDRARAATAYLPASTFKVPAALIALETGTVKDAYRDVLLWDGVEWMVEACNQNQTLATALQRSCLPIFAALGKRIGDERLGHYLAAFDYGNHAASGTYPYWIDGDLRISAFEQIAFLDRLREGALPASPEHMRTVRDILVIEKGEGYVIRAKTGWAMSPDPDIGWIVGWVERGDDVYLFALNLDVVEPEHAAARLDIAKAALKELGALP
jgi:beta-lactamase class D